MPAQVSDVALTAILASILNSSIGIWMEISGAGCWQKLKPPDRVCHKVDLLGRYSSAGSDCGLLVTGAWASQLTPD